MSTLLNVIVGSIAVLVVLEVLTAVFLIGFIAFVIIRGRRR